MALLSVSREIWEKEKDYYRHNYWGEGTMAFTVLMCVTEHVCVHACGKRQPWYYSSCVVFIF